MIKVVADKNLYQISAFIPKDFEVSYFDPSEDLIIPDGTKALLLRTVSKINADTVPYLPGSLDFVATGSSGSDHIDQAYLKDSGIEFKDARGCNAEAVAEYVATALLLWADEFDKDLTSFKFGIIGNGHTGSTLNEILQKLGCTTLSYDPPLELRDPDFKSAGEEEILQCDILSFHTPLTRGGKFPTFHWLNEEKLNNRSFECIVNASRGGVTDEQAVLKAFSEKHVKSLITDVWENEPSLNTDMLAASYLGTPHIAGYSEQAKLMATKMITDDLCQHFNVNPVDTDLIEKNDTILFSNESQITLRSVLSGLHNIMSYDQALRAVSNSGSLAADFRKLRTGLPYRYEYSCLKTNGEILKRFPVIEKLGVTSA